MKEHKWDDFEATKELLEAAALATETSESEQETTPVANDKMRMTELRRRIEERLESKRIALECDYLMLADLDDETPDQLQ